MTTVDFKQPGAPAYHVGGSHAELPQLPEIPLARYCDDAFFQLEIEQVFRRTWLQVAHASEFPKAGSYLALDLPLAPILITRGQDGELRAFLNACRHRGAAVARDSQGCAARFTCPYHGWTYDLTGKLIGVSASQTFPGFDRKQHALRKLRCELWGGFVFINFDDHAPALSDWIEPLTRRFFAQASARLRVVSKQTWEIGCNWKMAAEAFRESYHVPTVHPATAAAALSGYETFFELYPNGGATIFIPYSKAILEQAFSGVTVRASTLEPLPGTDAPRYRETTLLASVFPNVTIGFQPMGFPVISAWPISVGRSRLDVTWYGMDWGDGPLPQEWHKVVADFTTLTEEDIANLTSMQKSVAAAPETGMPLGSLECLVYQMHAEIDKTIGIENVPDRVRVPSPGILDAFVR